MATDYPFLIRGAADATFLRHVSDFIDRKEGRFTPNKVDPGRREWLRMTADDINPAIAAKKLELVDRFAIVNWISDPNFDDLIGWIAEGGSVHPQRRSSARNAEASSATACRSTAVTRSDCFRGIWSGSRPIPAASPCTDDAGAVLST